MAVTVSDMLCHCGGHCQCCVVSQWWSLSVLCCVMVAVTVSAVLCHNGGHCQCRFAFCVTGWTPAGALPDSRWTLIRRTRERWWTWPTLTQVRGMDRSHSLTADESCDFYIIVSALPFEFSVLVTVIDDLSTQFGVHVCSFFVCLVLGGVF